MNNNVSKFTSSAGGVSMTEKFDYGKDNLAPKCIYLPARLRHVLANLCEAASAAKNYLYLTK